MGTAITSAAFVPGDWASVKAQYPLADDGVRRFDAFLLSPHVRPVQQAIERHRRGLDADPAGYLHANERKLDEAVAGAGARYLQVNATDLAFTDSTTMGLGLVYGGIRPKLDEFVTTEHDHYATHEALRLRGARVRRIRLYDDPASATPSGIVDAVVRGVGDRTGVLALTWVHSGTGVKLPLAEIGQALAGRRRTGLIVVVDGVHALGTEDGPVAIDAFDVLVAGCHKWLGGPRGTGVVWSVKAWEALPATIPTFTGRSYFAWLEGREPRFGEVPPGPAFTPGGYHSFEHRWALAQAFEFQTRIGRERAAERIRTLATRLKEGLAELPHVRLVTGLWLDEADVDAAVEAIRKLA